MRTKLSFAALAALALASCSSDELLEQNSGSAINFSVVASKPTRAGLAGTTAANLEHIKLWGMSNGKVFMGGTEGLDLQKTGSTWGYGSDLYFWPEQAINFYGIAPATAPTGITYTVGVGEGEQKIDFTTTADGKSDIVYSTNVGEKKAAHKTGNAVEMNMRHALSQVIFRLGNTNDNLKITVKEIKLVGVANAGTFTLAKETTAAAKPNQVKDALAWGSWELATTTGEYVIYNADATPYVMNGKVDALTFDTENKVDNNLFLLPQTLKPWKITTSGGAFSGVDGARIMVKCKVEQKTGVAGQYAQVWPKTVNADAAQNYAYVAIPLENPNNDAQKNQVTEDSDKATFDSWMQGKKYTYTLNFGQGAGYDPSDLTNPELVLVGINFDVKVETFQNGNTSDENKNGNINNMKFDKN